jgi:D-alanyl-D-alanine carboxypeptidase/D-alanyl-D-alanine-endopeptidase (penicillin-binding protein 4)
MPVAASTDSTAVVVSLPSGRVLYARNAGLALEPASNEKLCVTYTALVELGPGYRFPTEALGEGVRSGSTWRGDIVLKGFGDPSLTTQELWHLVTIVRHEGIRKVTGHIVADASYFDGRQTAPGWLPGFADVESPPLSALVVDRATHDGVIVSDPPLAAALEFRALLHAAGIDAGTAILGRASQSAAVLATIYSPSLGQILEFMDQTSDNFTAEMLLKAIGAQSFGSGTTAAGARAVVAALEAADIPLRGVRIADGSGLSRWDRATGAELSALLVTIWKNPSLRAIVVPALAIAGETGTLSARMTTAPTRGVVRAKTGTTDIASALSGFVGHSYAFVAIENGDPVNLVAARTVQDKFATVLASHTHVP